MNDSIDFGSITHLCFFGGTSLMADLINEVHHCFDISVVTSKRFLNNQTNFDKTFSAFLLDKNVSYLVTDTIDDSVESLITPNTLGICISSNWIFTKKLINQFKGRFINIHRSYLPFFRGCASISWMFMQGNFESGYSFHLMTPSIDAGPILASGKLYYTKEIPSMGEAYIKLEKKIVEEFKIFITAIKERKVLKLENQNEEMSTYFPRLNQKIHAYIDWMWSAEDI